MGIQRAAKSGKNTPWTPEKVRERIKTSVIADRLMKHVLGQIEMSPTQISAALGLLRKVLPDLAVTDLNIDGELRNRDVTDKPLTEEQWAEQYSAPH